MSRGFENILGTILHKYFHKSLYTMYIDPNIEIWYNNSTMGEGAKLLPRPRDL
jgi:hypothetical protein